MTKLLSSIIGKILEVIYLTISKIGSEPESISYFAMSILILTLIYKLAMLPVTLSNIKMQKLNAKFQPELKKLEAKYKHDPQLYQQKVMEFQREMGYNPLASCLPMLIQLLIIWALFPVMREPLKYLELSKDINLNFFWIKDITVKNSGDLILPTLLALTQFLFTKMNMPKTTPGEENNPMQGMNFTMQYAMPIMFFFFARSYQPALSIYWIFGNIIEMIFRFFIGKSQEEEVVITKKDKEKIDKK
ncbi:YidC/Oxa1 family membrane protein insertase [Lagierella sp.]|uniref:YidC/Oxa1 family membrane protein insertase n=1 Tax=Lagierella sp. TaxID=2849657 RepID=UPI0026133E27|nr:YidC/Oxa1 family membrane protein insertase [Lagierella sp.]